MVGAIISYRCFPICSGLLDGRSDMQYLRLVRRNGTSHCCNARRGRRITTRVNGCKLPISLPTSLLSLVSSRRSCVAIGCYKESSHPSDVSRSISNPIDSRIQSVTSITNQPCSLHSRSPWRLWRRSPQPTHSPHLPRIFLLTRLPAA